MAITEYTYQRYLLVLRTIFSLVLCASAAFFVYGSIHWQVMWDTSIMHYVNFLMDRGMVPYRDIIDFNLPGSYLMEGWAIHVFGAGDLGWRFYDFFLLAVLTGSLIVIALPYDWFAGLYAGVFFILVHALEGPRNAGQREEVMITLIMLGYALLFTAMRKQTPLFMLPFGFFIGFAASFKPTVAPLGFILLLMMAIVLRKRHISFRPYLVFGLIGLFAALLVTLDFFNKYNAFHDFVAISKRLLPYYASIGNKSFLVLLLFIFRSRFVLLSLLLGIVVTVINDRLDERERWEQRTLGVGIFFSVLSYFAQGKNFEHHLYAFEVFILLWSALQFTKAMGTRGWRHVIGLVVIAYSVLHSAPSYCRSLANGSSYSAQPDALEKDLIQLGGSSLQHQVQCLDMVDGCYSTLYRLKLLPNTGFMGDFMFFQPRGNSPMPYYRNMLWNDLHEHPPKVIVITNMWLAEGHSFAKMEQWPELVTYLHSAYTLEVTRTFSPSAYRIYVLKDAAQTAQDTTVR